MRKNQVSTGEETQRTALQFFNNLLKKMRRKFQISEKASLFRKMKQDNGITVENLTIKDVILILLFARPERKIIGRLMFVKETFLLTNRYFQNVFSELSYFPSHYGPYSVVLINSIENLSKEGLINIEQTGNQYGTTTYYFSLTDVGKIVAYESFEKLPVLMKETVITKRTAWDRMGYSGILRLVYSEYPEYTSASKIADKV